MPIVLKKKLLDKFNFKDFWYWNFGRGGYVPFYAFNVH